MSKPKKSKQPALIPLAELKDKADIYDTLLVEPLESTDGADLAIAGYGQVVAVVQHDPDIQTAGIVTGNNVVWHGDERARALLLAHAYNVLPTLITALEEAEAAVSYFHRKEGDAELVKLVKDALFKAKNVPGYI